MELLTWFVDLFLHLDKHLSALVQAYQGWTYLILFVVVFCETGLVVTPLLPGDSLLFAAGTIAALGGLDPWLLCLTLSVAAVLGDTVNYSIGHYLGPRVFAKDTRLLNRKHLLKAQAFYERHGAKTIVLARFVPIIRTFAPFVAGIGRMSYPRFLAYNVGGGIGWVLIGVWAGYFWGQLPFVKENFTLVLLGIVFISLLPPLIEVLRSRLARPAAGTASAPPSQP